MGIQLRPSDMCIKTLDDGREVVQLKGLAFDKSFIAEMRNAGVENWVDRREED